MSTDPQEQLDLEIERLRERLDSAEEMRRALIAEELDGFVVGQNTDKQRVVLLETSKFSSGALLERLPHCVVTVSHDGDILYANQRFAALVGRSLAQLFSTSISQLIVPDHQRAFHEFLLAGVPDSSVNFDLTHADGRCLACRARAVAVGNGFASLLVEDASSPGLREEAERALQAIHEGAIDGVVVGGEQIMLVADAHRPYRTLVDRMEQGAVTVDDDGDVLYANEQFASMVGEHRDALLGKPIRQLLGTDALDTALRAVAGTSSSSEIAIARSDGSRLKIAMRAQRIDGSDAITLILSDLSERDRYREIQERAQRNDQFLAVLAHELRNPLGSIRNAVETLRRSSALETGERKSIDVIGRQSETLARLVDDLLDVHRLHDGTIVLQRKPIDLRAVIGSAVQAVHSNAETKDQQIETELPDIPLYVNADDVRVAQVLGNLLFNACKFTDAGGKIRVIATSISGAQVPSARVEVIDSGIGIDPDLLDKIFEPYVQAPRNADGAPEGLGLGLSVARRLVELHEGSISARSDGPGRGSVFAFELPLCDPPVPIEGRSADAQLHTQLRILIADDDKDSATSLSTLLELLGHQTFTAQDGREALARAEDIRPHVTILDLGMPDMDGYAAARALRERPWAREMVLYALTGWGQSKDRDRTRDAGFDHHFVKPLSVDELIEDLQSRLSARPGDGARPTH